MHIVIYHDNDTQTKIALTEAARESVRLAFNPSGKASVICLKSLAAAFITTCDEEMQANPEAGRELAIAKTNMQTASMWAVLGGTKEL